MSWQRSGNRAFLSCEHVDTGKGVCGGCGATWEPPYLQSHRAINALSGPAGVSVGHMQPVVTGGMFKIKAVPGEDLTTPKQRYIARIGADEYRTRKTAEQRSRRAAQRAA